MMVRNNVQYKPYGLMADCHLHNWSQFASVNEHGNNTRLVGLINEMQRCVNETVKVGGDMVYIAGDLFHVRGSIKPSVFNLAYDFFANNTEVTFVIIAGNHDLETKIASDSSSALTALDGLDNVVVVNNADNPWTDGNVVAIPWIEDISIEKIKTVLGNVITVEIKDRDLILHAPINGVFKNVNEGLDPEELSELPVRRVFCGHFHNHKCWDFPDAPCEKVISIGGIAQHSFGESENEVGWMIVKPDSFQHDQSTQPRFETETLSHIQKNSYVGANNCYLKVVVDVEVKPAELEKVRKSLNELYKGVIFQMVPKQTERTAEHSVKSGASLEVSVSEYVTKMESAPTGLNENCQRVLKESGEQL